MLIVLFVKLRFRRKYFFFLFKDKLSFVIKFTNFDKLNLMAFNEQDRNLWVEQLNHYKGSKKYQSGDNKVLVSIPF